MNAMILAAGRGERLRPFTDSCPKPLLEVRGKALIEHHLQALATAGIERVVINVSWLADQIKTQIGNGSRFGLEIIYSPEDEAFETAGGVINAMPYLDDQFIVINGDIFTDYPLERLVNIESEAHLVLVDNPEHNPGGDFALDQGLVGNSLEDRYTFTGIAVYRKRFFEGFPVGKRALAPLLREAADANRISGEYYSGSWTDVGTVERWRSLA